MSDQDDVQSRIIDSVFHKRNAASGSHQEFYVGHLKIWEIDGDNDKNLKPRFIILASALRTLLSGFQYLIPSRILRQYSSDSQVSLESQWYILCWQNMET